MVLGMTKMNFTGWLGLQTRFCRPTIVSAGLVVAAALALPGVNVGASETFTTGSSDVIIQEINNQIRQTWKDNEVDPSPVADDAEWMRRVYLDIVGHIPAVEDVEKFLGIRTRPNGRS